jgi:hypothetical protein
MQLVQSFGFVHCWASPGCRKWAPVSGIEWEMAGFQTTGGAGWHAGAPEPHCSSACVIHGSCDTTVSFCNRPPRARSPLSWQVNPTVASYARLVSGIGPKQERRRSTCLRSGSSCASAWQPPSSRVVGACSAVSTTEVSDSVGAASRLGRERDGFRIPTTRHGSARRSLPVRDRSGTGGPPTPPNLLSEAVGSQARRESRWLPPSSNALRGGVYVGTAKTAHPVGERSRSPSMCACRGTPSPHSAALSSRGEGLTGAVAAACARTRCRRAV